MALDAAKLMPGGGGIPPGVVLCAWTEFSAPASKPTPSRIQNVDVRVTGRQTKGSLSLPNTHRGTCS
jgi:hypothetical protein